jgi:hypothetical protein
MSQRGESYHTYRQARQAQRRPRPPRLGLWVALVAVVVLVFGSFAEHISGVLLLLMFVAVVAYRAGLSRRPAAKPSITAAPQPDPEAEQLRRRVADLETELAAARASATAAWDAAADRPPRTAGDRPEDDERARLLDTRMSGVHPLGGQS